VNTGSRQQAGHVHGLLQRAVPFVKTIFSDLQGAWKNLRTAADAHPFPESDYLRDGIYELRVRYLHANYRMLYFFSRHQAVVLTHGLIKERRVPPSEIDRAMTLRKRFEADPESHTVQWER